jgi:hypothetical protein
MSEAQYKFPDENEDPKKKGSKESILKYGQAIYYHFNKNGYKIFHNDRNNFKKLMAYYLGSQPIDIYQKRMDCWDLETDQLKDEVFVNVNWQILNFAFKCINIVVEKVCENDDDIIATPVDPISVIEKDKRKYAMQAFLENREWMENNGIQMPKDMLGFDPENMPETSEELEVYMQMVDKDQIAMEAEIAVDLVFTQNKFQQIRREYVRMLAILGMCGVEEYNTKDGRTLMEFVSPDTMVVSNEDSEDMTNPRFGGRVKTITYSELKIQAGNQLTEEQYDDIYKNIFKHVNVGEGRINDSGNEEKMGTIFKFYYKTCNEYAYEKKKDKNGNRKFYHTNINRGKSEKYQQKYDGEREVLRENYEVVYEGIWIVGTEYGYNTGLLTDMEVKRGNTKETRIPLHAVAPTMLKGKVVSLLYSMLPILDEIQVNWLQFQHAIAKYIPDGHAIDLDAIVEAPLGKGGKNMKPRQVLDLYFKTGLLVYKGSKINGSNPNGLPVRPMPNGNIEKASFFLQNVLNLVNVLRDQTGINQAMDASSPSPDALVGTQQMALSGAENAIGFLYHADKLLKKSLAESAVMLTQNLVKRKQVSGLTNALGTATAKFWEINKDISLKDLAIDLEPRPTKAEWADFYGLLKDSMAKQSISEDDYIDIMRVKNLKLASEMMKSRKKRRAREKAAADQANIQFQSQQNTESAMAIEQAKQATLQKDYELKTQHELALKDADGKLLDKKYNYELQLKGMEVQSKEAQKHMESDTKIVTKLIDIQKANKEKTKSSKQN